MIKRLLGKDIKVFVFGNQSSSKTQWKINS